MKRKTKHQKKAARAGQTFGTTIRAYRLGYRRIEGLDCWAQIKQEGNVYRITLCPLDQPPPNTAGKSHFCFWENPAFKDFRKLLPSLKHVKRIKTVISLTVDENGELL